MSATTSCIGSLNCDSRATELQNGPECLSMLVLKIGTGGAAGAAWALQDQVSSRKPVRAGTRNVVDFSVH